MRRSIMTLALATAMVLGGASVAVAHPDAAEANAEGFGSEPALTGFANAGDHGLDGRIQGFVTHAPTCLAHPILGH